MNTTKKITFAAIFTAIATVIMYFEFPLPFMPPFLKIDLSGAVILIGAFVLGIGPALAIAFAKDVIHLLSTTTGGSGELADFLMTATLIAIAYIVYRQSRTRKTAVLGCICGSFAMSIMGMLTNKFLIIPFYSMTMPIDAIIRACAEINPFIGSLNGYLLFGVLPFNLLKGTIVSIIALAVYKKLGSFLRTYKLSIN